MRRRGAGYLGMIAKLLPEIASRDILDVEMLWPVPDVLAESPFFEGLLRVLPDLNFSVVSTHDVLFVDRSDLHAPFLQRHSKHKSRTPDSVPLHILRNSV